MDFNTTPMLVYEHRTNGPGIVPNGVGTMNEYDLVIALSMHPDIRMVQKSITQGATTFDLFRADLMTEEEKVGAITKAENGAVQKEEVPWKVFLGHGYENHTFTEVKILVPEVVAKGGKEGSREDTEQGGNSK